MRQWCPAAAAELDAIGMLGTALGAEHEGLLSLKQSGASDYLPLLARMLRDIRQSSAAMACESPAKKGDVVQHLSAS